MATPETPDSSSDAAWKRVEDLFHGALELPPGERDGWLKAQAAEPSVKAEVQSLMESLQKQDDEPAEESDPPSLPQAPGLPADRFGAYRLVRLLGRGGMSAVYLAERADGLFERSVAIKVIAAHLGTEDFLRRFQNEGKLLAALQHPNIASLLDGGVSVAGHPYLVLELVEGERLDQHADTRRLSIADRLRLFRQVCEAVDYAHRSHILHRDLKPANILVTAEGVVKLVDFGTAALMDQDVQLTVTRTRMLTPRYASPEQLRGGRPGVTGDVYSLGVILYELLAGAWPFGDPNSVLSELKRATGEATPAALATVLTAEAAELRGQDYAAVRRSLEGDLQAIVDKALQGDPEQRYGTVREFIEDLDHHGEGLPVDARRSEPARSLQVPRWTWWAAAAVLVLACGGWYLRRERPATPNRKAAEFYQLGQYHWSRHTQGALLKAADAFREATKADPGFAPAYAYLADAYAMLPEYGINEPQRIEEGRRAGQRALELDSRLSVAHGALAWIAFTYDWKWAEAEPEFRTAIALAPQEALPHQRYGLALITRSRFAEAEAELRRAQQLDPVSVIAMINLAELWYYTHRFDREEEILRRILELDPNSVLAHIMMAKLKTVSGQSKEAVVLTEKLQTLPEGANWCQELSEALARDGQRDAALRQMNICQDPVVPGIYEYLGDFSKALDILELRFAAHAPEVQYLNVDPNYDEMRNEPRYQAMLRKLGL